MGIFKPMSGLIWPLCVCFLPLCGNDRQWGTCAAVWRLSRV